MGCYGIGVTRVLAAAIEQNHDDKGIIFPAPIAPFQAHLLALNASDPDVIASADALYEELTSAGCEVLYDDRAESAGVKFNDADLLGLPVRIVVSPRNLKQGRRRGQAPPLGRGRAGHGRRSRGGGARPARARRAIGRSRLTLRRFPIERAARAPYTEAGGRWHEHQRYRQRQRDGHVLRQGGTGPDAQGRRHHGRRDRRAGEDSRRRRGVLRHGAGARPCRHPGGRRRGPHVRPRDDRGDHASRDHPRHGEGAHRPLRRGEDTRGHRHRLHRRVRGADARGRGAPRLEA